MVDVATVVVTALITGPIGLAGGTSWEYATKRTTELLNVRRLKKMGDHVAIDSPHVPNLDNYADEQIVLGVAAAPSMSFSKPVKLDVTRIDAWRRGLPRLEALPLDYSDPDELLRYRSTSNRSSWALFTPTGLINVVVPIEQADAATELAVRLDLTALVKALAPVVGAIAAGAHEELYPGALRTKRLDWRIQVSRSISPPPDEVYGTQPAEAWEGLRFPGPTPPGTDRQKAPTNKNGLAGPELTNRPSTDSAESVVRAVIYNLIERAGYYDTDEIEPSIDHLIRQA
ncbi:MAG: hypothetical protein JWM34_482 [Ilumatobacteraceae bacterium]|nr:hypothetical protein [Ilumatobacteraceae bacterium]